MKHLACYLSALTLLAACGAPTKQALESPGHRDTVASLSGQHSAILTWVQGPKAAPNNVLHLQFFDGPDAPISEQVEVKEFKPWMAIHGHGAPMLKQKITLLSANLFEVSGINFIMSGPWELQVKIASGATEDSFKFPVSVP